MFNSELKILFFLSYLYSLILSNMLSYLEMIIIYNFLPLIFYILNYFSIILYYIILYLINSIIKYSINIDLFLKGMKLKKKKNNFTFSIFNILHKFIFSFIIIILYNT